MATTAPATPIPSVDAFKRDTTPTWSLGPLRGKKKVSRNNIGLIDLQLQRWEDAERRRETSWHVRRSILIALLGECRAWLANRSTKRSKNLAVRRPQVENLARVTFEWLKYVQFESLKWDAKNLPMMGTRQNVGGMQPGYAAERDVYIGNNKQTMPLAGTAVHQHVGALKKDVQTGGLDPNTLPPAVAALLNKQWSNFTDADYIALANYIRSRGRASDSQLRVWYMSKTHRRDYMLLIHNGKFMKGFDLPLEIKPGRTLVYAIDQYGSIFAADAGDGDPTFTADGLNHSTLNAGKDVICAGNITVQFGKPTIDNGSGHYAPTRQQLYDAINLLSDSGLDLTEWNVGIFDPNAKVTVVYPASTFKGNINITGPVIGQAKYS